MKKIVKNVTLFLAVLALFSMVGCASKTDMEAIQGQRQQDLTRMKQLESELEESKRLLKDEIEKSNSPIREKSADMWAEIQSIRAELASMRGQMDDISVRMDRQMGAAESEVTMDGLKKQLDDLEFTLEDQLQLDLNKAAEERKAAQAAADAAAAAATPDGVAAVPAAPVAGQPTTTDTVVPVAPITPPADTDPAKALYDKAYALYKDGQYEKARSYWAEFTDTFKKHSFTPSAVFWQGQCYYKLKDYARAAILFEDVIEKYKKSSKYKAALLKSGYSWSYLGKPELAKMRLQEVVKKFPKSVEATQAKRTLDKMK